MLRSLSEGRGVWGEMSQGTLEQAISLPKRVGIPRGRGKVVWATGDAVIGKIGATNWHLNEYILEDSDDYLPEITSDHRRTTISDDEQLIATCIISEWTHREKILLLGTDKRNAMAWTTNGYAKRWAALVLNQENARWIAMR